MHQSPKNPTSEKHSFTLTAAVLSGFIAGITGAALDLIQARNAIATPEDLQAFSLQLFSRLTLAGVITAVVGGLLIYGSITLAARARLREKLVLPVVFALTLLPGSIYIARNLFEGGFMSRLPAQTLLIAATSIFLFIGTAVVVVLLQWAFGRDAYLRRKPLLFKLSTVTLLILALVLHWCDAYLYVRLYGYLHSALTTITLILLCLFYRLFFFSSTPGKAARISAAIAAVMAVASTAAAVFVVSVPQTVMVAINENTAMLANVLKWESALSEGTKRRDISDAIRRTREERARAERESGQKVYPSFPGAHVILISVDALRADRLGVLGYDRRPLTPYIDQFAATATNFERAYCSAPHSSYAITSFHTSRYTHVEGMLGRTLTYPTLAEILSRSGYKNAAFYTSGIFFTEGERVEHYKNNKFGFSIANHGAPDPDRLTDYGIDQINRFNAEGEPPFFLWMHYFNVHDPYKSTKYGTAPVDRYEGEIERADAAIGRLIKYLDTHLDREKIIVFMSDHGEEFQDHGGHYHGSSLYDEQTRVPLIIRVPGASPQKIATPVSSTDMAPTVLKLLGLDPEPGMVGRDLRPAVFEGNDALVPRPVFSSVVKQHMAVMWPWKLVADPSRNVFKLYNLSADPKEMVNVYDANTSRAKDMLGEIDAWLDEIAVGEDPADTVLNLGRMRSKNAISGLIELAENKTADLDDRLTALKLLAEIRAWDEEYRLTLMLDDAESAVSTYAALALAAIENHEGVEILSMALFDDNPDIRYGAALALGRLKNKEAVPVLIEALGQVDMAIREAAFRYLGQLKDPSAIDALVASFPEDRTRYLAVLALGEIGDPRGIAPIVDLLKVEEHVDIRGYAAVALGWIEARETLPLMMEMTVKQPEIKWTPETLIRLGALQSGEIAGFDATEESVRSGSGFQNCRVKARVISDEYMDRTTCETIKNTGLARFSSQEMDKPLAIVRLRHLLADKAAKPIAVLSIDGKELAKIALGADFEEHRIALDQLNLRSGNHTAQITLLGDGAIQLDHFILIPTAEQ